MAGQTCFGCDKVRYTYLNRGNRCYDCIIQQEAKGDPRKRELLLTPLARAAEVTNAPAKIVPDPKSLTKIC